MAIIAGQSFILFLILWMPEVRGMPAVTLTVEGGVSLVGPHCPGTVGLLCEGVDITFLRWRYNGVNDIYSFLTTDSPPTSVALYTPAFATMVYLSSVTRKSSRFANLSSVLTVDLDKLQEMNVTDITCGDASVSQTVPVDVNIKKLYSLDSPMIINVSAVYNNMDTLHEIGVTWRKVNLDCPVFEDAVKYFVLLNGVNTSQANLSNCAKDICKVVFTEFSPFTPFNVSLILVSSAFDLMSRPRMFPTTIEKASRRYFNTRLSVDNNNCEGIFMCTPEPAYSDDVNGRCTLQFVASPTHESATLMVPFNTEYLLPKLVSSEEIEYRFSFILSVNDLQVVKEMDLILKNACSDQGMCTCTGAVVSTIGVLIICFIMSSWIITYCLARIRRRKYNFDYPLEQRLPLENFPHQGQESNEELILHEEEQEVVIGVTSGTECSLQSHEELSPEQMEQQPPQLEVSHQEESNNEELILEKQPLQLEELHQEEVVIDSFNGTEYMHAINHAIFQSLGEFQQPLQLNEEQEEINEEQKKELSLEPPSVCILDEQNRVRSCQKGQIEKQPLKQDKQWKHDYKQRKSSLNPDDEQLEANYDEHQKLDREEQEGPDQDEKPQGQNQEEEHGHECSLRVIPSHDEQGSV